MRKHEHDCLDEVGRDEREASGETAGNEATKEKLLWKPGLDDSVEQSKNNSRRRHPEASEHVLRRCWLEERCQWRPPDREHRDQCGGKEGAVEEVLPLGLAKPGPTRHLGEAALVAQSMVDKVDEKWYAPDHRDIEDC